MARIVATPTRPPVTNPEALMSAIDAFKVDHITPEAGEVLPEASVIVAVA
jgi:hypothetical protein